MILAFKNDKVSRVSPIFYTESVIGLFMDYFMFQVAFGALQFLGICLVFCMFGWKIALAYKEE
jgi:drug/metabolite transporter (DMT)-like permease